jgi:hypothetical protein
MIPGIATKPENLQPANTGVSPQAPLLRVSTAGNGMRGGDTPIAIRDSGGNPVRSYSDLMRGGGQQQPSSLSSIPGYHSGGQSSPVTPVPTAAVPNQPQGTPTQQRWQSILGSQTNKITPTAIQAATINAAGPGAPLSSVGSTDMPNLGVKPLPSLGPAPRGTLPGDTNEYNRLVDTGSGISQIKNPVGRGFARAADIAETIFAPNIERITPGTAGNNQRLIALAGGRVANDQGQLQAQANLEDTQGQTLYRQQQAAKDQAQAQADATRQPTPQEAADYNLDPNAYYRPADIGRAAVQASKNAGNLQTHTGGQSHKVSTDDAKLVGAPALEGETLSNDAWQKMVSGVQRNAQSGSNNAATNQNRATTTSMRDATSTGNSERTHPGKGAGVATPKPIPAGVKDRIESQKNTAISKAKADFDSGDTDLQGYISRWQQAQDDYEARISAQTGSSVPHLDIRRNTDAKGNWTGANQPATAQPQAQQPANRPAFITRKGSTVALGDPVNVNGKKGTVTGFNPVNGKAQVKWEAAQ